MIPRPEMIPKMDRKWSSTASDPKVAFSAVIVVSGRHDLPFDAQNISFDLFLIAVLFIAAK